MTARNFTMEQDAAFALWQTLSEQERRVARALAEEKAPKEIAAEMSIAPRTVAVYIERARVKLRVGSPVGIALIVARAGQL